MTSTLRCLCIILLCCPFLSFAESGWKWTGPEAGQVRLIVPDPQDAKTWYVVNGDRLYRSTDGAQSWKDSGLPGMRYVYSSDSVGAAQPVAVHPATSEVAAITSGERTKRRILWVSRDGGETFQQRATVPFPLRGIYFHPRNPDILYGLGLPKYDLGVSYDGGRTWSPLTNLKLTPSNQCFKCELGYYTFKDIVVSQTNSDVLYASGEAYFENPRDDYERESSRALWVSQDRGASWKILERDETYAFYPDPETGDMFAFNPDPGDVKLLHPLGVKFISRKKLHQLVAIPHTRSEFIGVYYAKAFHSGDGGQSWQDYPLQSLGAVQVRVQVLSRSSLTLLVGTDGAGLFRGSAEAGFGSANRGFRSTEVFNLAKSERNLYALLPNAGFGQSSYLYRSTNDGGSWKSLTAQLPTRWIDNVYANPKNPSNVYLAGSDSSLWISNDAGETWKKSDLHSRECCHWSLAFNPKNPKEMYAKPGIDTVYRSLDGGLTFSKVFAVRSWIDQVIADETDPGTLFLVTNDGFFKSVGGATPVSVNSGLQSACPECGRVVAVSLSPLQLPNAYLAMISVEDKNGSTHRVMYRTLDGAQSWELYGQNPRKFFGQIFATDFQGTHSYVMTSRILYETLDGGKSWSNISSLLGKEVYVRDIPDPRHLPLFVVTNRGVYRRVLP